MADQLNNIFGQDAQVNTTQVDGGALIDAIASKLRGLSGIDLSVKGMPLTEFNLTECEVTLDYPVEFLLVTKVNRRYSTIDEGSVFLSLNNIAIAMFYICPEDRYKFKSITFEKMLYFLPEPIRKELSLQQCLFEALHKNDIGIDGLISNILHVDWHEDSVDIFLLYASSKHTKKRTESMIHIDFYDPDGSYRQYTSYEGEVYKKHLNDKNTNNVRIVYMGSSIAIETVVMAAHIWTMCAAGKALRYSYSGMCADVLNASGSKRSRERYGLKYDISPDNLELVSRRENNSRSSHRQHKMAKK